MLMVWKEGLDSQWWIKFLYFFSVALGIKSGTSCILHYWVTSTALGVCFSLGTFGVFACFPICLFLFSGDRVSLCRSGWSDSYTQGIVLPQLIGATSVWYHIWLTELRFGQKRKVSCWQKFVLWPGGSLWRRQKKSFGQALLWAPHYISASECGCISVFRLAKECEQFTNERVESNGHPGLFA